MQALWGNRSPVGHEVHSAAPKLTQHTFPPSFPMGVFKTAHKMYSVFKEMTQNCNWDDAIISDYKTTDTDNNDGL